VVIGTPVLVQCFWHDGTECSRCDGSDFRLRRRCAGCEVPAGRPSHKGVGFFHEHGTESCKELKSLPLYGTDCNPHFFRTESKLFEETGI
jgi:hypothetical protein